MEFTRPNRDGRRRPQPNAPQSDGARSINSRIIQHASPIDKKPVTHLVTPPSTTVQAGARSNKTISSKTAATSFIRRSFFAKKTIVVGAIVIVILGASIAGLLMHQQDSTKDSAKKSLQNETIEDLEYQTILPHGKSIRELGGWKRVSPSDREPVYAYTDAIGEIPISVSQQPLPKAFIADTDGQVAELAKKFNATSNINAGDVKVYVGSSTKGPQSAIFTKNSLLILIKSEKKIGDSDWAKYVKSLN